MSPESYVSFLTKVVRSNERLVADNKFQIRSWIDLRFACMLNHMDLRSDTGQLLRVRSRSNDAANERVLVDRV